MDKAEQIYRSLQQHLDRQAVGYPATKSGAVPPQDTEGLYDVIMANKKGTFGKIELATKLMLKK